MKLIRTIAKCITPVALLAAFAVTNVDPVDAATLANVSVTQTKPEAAAAGDTYGFYVSNQSATSLRCVTVSFNTAANGTGAVPNGFSASGATIAGSFLPSWSTWTSSNSAGVAKATSSTATAPNTAAGVQIQVANVTNGTDPDVPVYVSVKTFSDAGCTTSVDSVGVTFNWTTDGLISTVVDPALTFSVNPLNGGSCNGATITGTGSSSTAVAMGTVNKTSRAIGGQQLTVATNAGNGASIYAHVDGPLRDTAGHTIASIGASAAAPGDFTNPGTEAFGYTVDSQMSGGIANRFSAGGTKWASIGTNDQEVVYSPYSIAPISGCIAYQITISKDTFGGFYGDNVYYTAVPSF